MSALAIQSFDRYDGAPVERNLIASDAAIVSSRGLRAEDLEALRQLVRTGLRQSLVAVRPDPQRPGFFDLEADGVVFCVLVYPGGRRLRVLAAARARA